MKVFLALFLAFAGLFFVSSSAQDSNDNKLGQIVLFIDSIKSNQGNIRIHLYNYDKRKYFPTKTEHCYKLKVGNIENGKCLVKFDDLPFDTYCLSVHHDENANQSMDLTFFGLPDEGWGISNNVKLWYRIPKFDECSFKLDKRIKIINVEMRY